jgi:PAS domain-containing protein
MKHKSGAWVWIHDRGQLLTRGPQKEPLLMSGIHTDITSRKKMEINLLETKRRLSMASKAGGVGIWDYNLNNNTMIWDDQMCVLYGLSKEDFRNSYDAWLTRVHPEDRKRSDEEIQEAIRGEKEFKTEFRIVWPDESIHTIRAKACLNYDEFHKPISMIGKNWDIT